MPPATTYRFDFDVVEEHRLGRPALALPADELEVGLEVGLDLLPAHERVSSSSSRI